jgi:parallel beta-helix repeat protein
MQNPTKIGVLILLARKLIIVFGMILVLLAANRSFSIVNSVVVNGPIFIQQDGSVEPISAPIQRNGDIYTLTDDVASFSDGIVIEIDGITLDGAGHTVQGIVNSSAPSTNETTGINLTGQSNVTIENTNVMGFTDGIMLSASNNLENVSNFNTIVGNNLTSDGNGIILAPSNGSEILSNDISDNGVGISVSDFSMNNSIGTNTLTGNPLGIFLNDSENNYVYANSVSSMYDSIWLDGSSNNSLTLNTVSTAYYGNGIILLDSSNYNAIVGNDVTNCDEGLSLRSSSNFGILVGNTIEGNFRGLENIGSSNDTIARNDISNSGWFNFRLSGCSGDLVYENSITGNAISIWLASSSNNSFYHNFIGSTDVTLVPPNSNTWDDGYPSGGNYWVGANLTDRFSGAYQTITGSDGICDSPVVLNANNTDRYPLAGPFYSFNATSEHYVQILSNSTISNFRFNGTAILFDMTGENGTDGFCRISIPLDMMSGPFSVFVNGTQVTFALIPNSNDSLGYLYFSLHFSTQEITVIPEYSAGVLVISLMLVALAVLVHKKRR